MVLVEGGQGDGDGERRRLADGQVGGAGVVLAGAGARAVADDPAIDRSYATIGSRLVSGVLSVNTRAAAAIPAAVIAPSTAPTRWRPAQ